VASHLAKIKIIFDKSDDVSGPSQQTNSGPIGILLDISQIFPEIKVIPEEEIFPFSTCGCPPQLLLLFLFLRSPSR